MKILSVLLLTCVVGTAQTEFEVIRKKPLWFDQKGTITISESGLSFTPTGKNEEPLSWKYQDVQHVDRVSPTEIIVLSYEDVAWKLGRDRSYRFDLVSGELSDELFDQVVARIGKPSTDRVVERPGGVEQELPVKHLSGLGGSEGTLYFSPERIVYSTEKSEQSREWLLDRDVHSVWSSDVLRLEVHAYERNAGAFRKPRVYRFALKRPLDGEFYRRLKLRLYGIERARR
jgi:hypothetical protein